MVVLAWRPAADSPINGSVLATMKAKSAAKVRARGRSMGSVERVAMVLAHRAQRAVAPGGRGGMPCSRSQCGHARVSTAQASVWTLTSRPECPPRTVEGFGAGPSSPPRSPRVPSVRGTATGHALQHLRQVEIEVDPVLGEPVPSAEPVAGEPGPPPTDCLHGGRRRAAAAAGEHRHDGEADHLHPCGALPHFRPPSYRT